MIRLGLLDSEDRLLVRARVLGRPLLLGRDLALRRRDGGFTMGCAVAVETPLGLDGIGTLLLHHQYYHYFPSLHHQYYE